LIHHPEYYPGLFAWEPFVTIERRPNGGRETTFLTQYERSKILPILAVLPSEEHFGRGCRDQESCVTSMSVGS